jgi:HEAT repeat protein
MDRLARKPNVKSLSRREDVEGLVEATSYRELTRTSLENVTDLGIPVRAAAILALGELGPRAGHEAVVLALRDPADRVRCAAVRVMHARQDADGLVQALRWLPTDEGQSRIRALQAIRGLHESLTPAALADALIHRDDEELLSEDDAPLIHGLLEEEQGTTVDDLIQLLISSLADERGIVIDRAGELLRQLAPATTEAVVAELRTGPAAAEAAYVLGGIADPQTLDALVEALRHDDPTVRAESAAALAELQDPAAVEPLLLRATEDKEHAVRMKAGKALERLGTVAVIVGVASLLKPMIDDAIAAALSSADASDRPLNTVAAPTGPEAISVAPVERRPA